MAAVSVAVELKRAGVSMGGSPPDMRCVCAVAIDVGPCPLLDHVHAPSAGRRAPNRFHVRSAACRWWSLLRQHVLCSDPVAIIGRGVGELTGTVSCLEFVDVVLSVNPHLPGVANGVLVPHLGVLFVRRSGAMRTESKLVFNFGLARERHRTRCGSKLGPKFESVVIVTWFIRELIEERPMDTSWSGVGLMKLM